MDTVYCYISEYWSMNAYHNEGDKAQFKNKTTLEYYNQSANIGPHHGKSLPDEGTDQA